jgi:hypothetical protein
MNISTKSLHKKNIGLDTPNVKNKVLKYLYTHVNLKLKPENVKNEKDLNNIKDNDYIICPQFSGTRSWIMFFQLDDVYYAVNFPKHSQTKKDILQIHPIDVSVCEDFYYGTIMEGIFFRMDEKKFLVIDEVYMLTGQDQLLKPKDDRLKELSIYLTKNMMHNPNFQINVSQFYYVNKQNLQTLYEKIKSDTKINELIFYPKNFGLKIYNYTIIDSDLIDNVIKLTTFSMHKTESPDVYNLLSVSSGKKIGIAYIPDMETSKRCKQWFKDYKTKKLLVKCQMSIEKNKWIPMEIIETDLGNNEIVEV